MKNILKKIISGLIVLLFISMTSCTKQNLDTEDELQTINKKKVYEQDTNTSDRRNRGNDS